MKHRLTEFLATEMGFTLFAIEANMPEAYRINEYVLTGEGDPKELLRGLYFWMWDTPGSARPGPVDAPVQRVGPRACPVPRLRHAVRRAGDEQHTSICRQARSGLCEGARGRLSRAGRILGRPGPRPCGPGVARRGEGRRGAGGVAGRRASRGVAPDTGRRPMPTGSSGRSRTPGTRPRRRS